MKRVLLVLEPRPTAPPLTKALFDRTQELTWVPANSVDEARRVLSADRFDAIFVEPPRKTMSFNAFVSFVGRLEPRPLLLVLGADAPGGRRIEPGDPTYVADQILDLLGLRRSAVHDLETVAELFVRRPFELHVVREPGSEVLMVRGSASRELEEDEVMLARRAMEAGQPATLEVFWDDPRPHALFAVSPGRSLREVLSRRPLSVPEVLAVIRGVAMAMRAMHEVGLSAGLLGAGRVWLGVDGSVSLPGHGFAQLTPERMRFAPPIAGLDPPEHDGAPAPEGDAFRLGTLLHSLLGVRAFDGVDLFAFLSGNWPAWPERVTAKLGPAAPRLDALLSWSQPRAVATRPRGERLVALVAQYAPSDSTLLLQRLASE